MRERAWRDSNPDPLLKRQPKLLSPLMEDEWVPGPGKPEEIAPLSGFRAGMA